MTASSRDRTARDGRRRRGSGDCAGSDDPRGAERGRGPAIRTKRVREPREARDGARVLVMRLWPRGVRKHHVDLWLRELGPTLPLLRAFRSGRIPWTTFRRRYLAELERPEARRALAEVGKVAQTRGVTLLCGCADATRCHRTLLRNALTRRPTGRSLV